MKLILKILLKCLGNIFLAISIYYNCNAQNLQQPNISKRTKDNFDFNLQFRKGDIAMKRVTSYPSFATYSLYTNIEMIIFVI
jgi:hypothetical protein